ncbi:ribokinase [Shinella sp. CPCC 100929]|uniref:Ribokinase n=1 Tax=Shinella lacus TaxID=2654216 RepID=A0ABT1RBS6_9HYPH|nr:ribokinase [Shinella lacus]
MTILNIGSINVDTVYHVRSLPMPGETMTAGKKTSGPGGKGLNQSVAIARAGAPIKHFGAVGDQDRWLVDAVVDLGLDASSIRLRADDTTGQAHVFLAADGENSIVLERGANFGLTREEVEDAVGQLLAGDWVLLQNETNAAPFAMEAAKSRGLKVAYSAAPYVRDDVIPLLGKVDLLALNRIEFDQLLGEVGSIRSLPSGMALLVTGGRDGATYRSGDEEFSIGAFDVEVVDTTGAGDTFLGYFLAEMHLGAPPVDALRMASAAAALQVTLIGSAPAIPARADVMEFLKARTS